MDRDKDLGRITGWFRRQREDAAEVKSSTVSVETLLASTEYELSQLRRAFDGVQLATRPPEVAALPMGPVDKAAFERKLRNPESRKTPEWWVALGLGLGP